MRKNLTLFLGVFLAMLLGFSTNVSAQRTRSLKQELLQKAGGGDDAQKLLELTNKSAKKHSRALSFLPTTEAPAGLRIGKAPKLAETTSDIPVIWGNVVAGNIPRDPYTGDYLYGVYQITSNNGNLSVDSLHTGAYMQASGGGVFTDDTYHFMSYTSFYGWISMSHYAYNFNTWQSLLDEYGEDIEDYSLYSFDQTFDITTKKIYGLFLTSDQEKVEFGVIDYGTLTRTTISEDTIGALTISADKDGQLFEIASDGNLYKVDKETGKQTLVGATGFNPGNYTQSATFDLKNNKIYWAACLADQTSHLICVDPATGKGTDLGTFPGNQEIVTLYIPTPTAMAAPDHVNDVVIDFPNGSSDGTVSFTMPTQTYDGQALTGDLTYKVDADGETVATGTAQPGAQVNANATVNKNGKVTFNISVSNDVGTSVATNDKVFVGLDEPKDIQKVTLTADGQKAKISWDAPTEGSFGGYVSQDSLYYMVWRMPGQILVADSLKATSFEETIPDGGYKSYFYAVQPFNGSHSGYATMSNHVVFGHAYDVPYDVTYTDSTDLDVFKVIDANGDGYTWEFSDYGTTGIRYYTNWSDQETPADDWLVSPGITLESSKAYKLSLYTNTADSVTYSVSYGTGDDVSAYKELQPMTTKAYNIAQPRDTVSFTIPVLSGEGGEYHFAVHCQSKGSWLFFYLQRMTVTEGPSMESPDSVTNISVVPAPLGKLSADVKFTVPSKSIGGTALDNVNIDVYRNDTVLVKTLTAAAGSEATVTDDEPVNGFNKYTVKTSNAAGEGQPNSATAWVGIDTPTPPTNVRAYISGDATESVHVSWDAPKGNVGVHGGYFDPDNVLYKLTDFYNGNQGDSLDATERIISDAIVQTQNRQSQVYFNVQALNAGGLSAKAQSNNIWNGKPQDTPMQEDFNGTYNGGYYTTYGYPRYTWTTVNKYTEFKINYKGSADGDGYSQYWNAVYDNNDSLYNDGYLNSFKINLENVQNPTLAFNYIAYPGFKNKLYIDAFDCKGDTVHLDSIDYAQLTGERGWRLKTVDLVDYKSQGNPFLLLSFHANDYSNAGQDNPEYAVAGVCLDNIRIFDRKDDDLKAAKLYGSTSADVNDTITYYVKVENWGENPVLANEYTVNIVNENDSVLASANGVAIDGDWWTYVPVKFAAKVTDRENQQVRGKVVFDLDADNDNNVTDLQDLHISKPVFPTVTDLKATTNAKNTEATLSWNEPAGIEAQKITEGFEDYDAFTISNFGRWTLVDADSAYGYTINGLDLPNVNTPAAYQIFNATELGLDEEEYPAYFPHEGNQCAVSKAAIPQYAKNGHNDDWLISPELTGDAQTISLWAKSTGQQQLETFEVLYSTTGKDTADFKLLDIHDRISADWTEYTADLPEGTKYFAIRCISADKNFFFVDDVTFSAAAMNILNYNIYDNGELIGKTEGTETTYVDNRGDGGSHHYQVTVVYDCGESALSNAADIETVSGIAKILASGKPFDIYSVDGIRVAHDVTTVKGLKSGVYIIDGNKFVVK